MAVVDWGLTRAICAQELVHRGQRPAVVKDRVARRPEGCVHVGLCCAVLCCKCARSVQVPHPTAAHPAVGGRRHRDDQRHAVRRTAALQPQLSQRLHARAAPLLQCTTAGLRTVGRGCAAGGLTRVRRAQTRPLAPPQWTSTRSCVSWISTRVLATVPSTSTTTPSAPSQRLLVAPLCWPARATAAEVRLFPRTRRGGRQQAAHPRGRRAHAAPRSLSAAQVRARARGDRSRRSRAEPRTSGRRTG
jgi:hypothetical protein